VPLAPLGHGEGSRAKLEAQAPAVCVLWRRKAHLHNPLDDANIPAEVGRLVRSRARAQQSGVMGITFCQSLAPFLDPGFLNALSPGPIRGARSMRSLLQEIAQQGPISHPFFAPTSFPPQKQ
jgi:hypothetical protein